MKAQGFITHSFIEHLYNTFRIHKPFQDFPDSIDVEFEVVETKSKRQELEDSLRYLKSKVNKTVQDKNSIGVIEAVLKNM